MPARRVRYVGQGLEVQSLMFSRDVWDVAEAKAWAAKHNFYSDKVDVQANTIRLRQYNPSIYFPKSFRTIQLGVDSGVQAIIARRLHPRKR